MKKKNLHWHVPCAVTWSKVTDTQTHTCRRACVYVFTILALPYLYMIYCSRFAFCFIVFYFIASFLKIFILKKIKFEKSFTNIFCRWVTFGYILCIHENLLKIFFHLEKVKYMWRYILPNLIYDFEQQETFHLFWLLVLEMRSLIYLSLLLSK